MTELKETELDLDLMDNWLLWDWYQETDFLLVNGSWLPKLFQQDEEIYEYNQGTTNDCTIYSAFWAISDLMNYKFSEAEIKDINELSYTMGRKRGNWWFVFKAIDCVRKRWNNNKELVKKYWKVASYRIDLRDDVLIDEILDKGYTICSWYDGNGKYNVDFTIDDQLDWAEFGSPTYWHAVSWRKVNGERCIKDNYAGRKYNWVDTNIYKVIPACSKLVENNVYFQNAYLFTKVAEDNYEELIRLEKVKALCNNVLEANSALWNWTNDKTLQNKLHDTSERIRNNNLKYIEENKEKLR